MDLGRDADADNGARRPVRLTLCRAAVALWAASAGGCSLSIPISGMQVDAGPTGSVDRTTAMLSPSLDREDIRRARAAMAVTLDPQGNGSPASWRNPQTGAHGGFAAAAAPYADRDRVCRRFSGEVVPAGHPARQVSGAACREGDGTWQVMASADTAA